MANLEKDLENLKKNRLKQQKKVEEDNEQFDAARQLLSGQQSEEINALKTLGLDKEINIVEQNKQLNALNQIYEKKFEDGKIYHISEIEKLAMKYRLYLRPTRMYRGGVPADLAPIIVRLKKQHNLYLGNSNNSDSGKFFILAPPSSFSDYISPKLKIQTFFDQTLSPIKNFKRILTDPIAFYQIDNEHYLFLKKWGSDFTFFRRVLGFLTGGRFRMRIWQFILGIVLPIFVLKNMFDFHQYMEFNDYKNWDLLIPLSWYLITGFIMFFYLIYCVQVLSCNAKSKIAFTHFLTKSRWNTPWKNENL